MKAIYYIIFCLVFIGCNSKEKFNSEKWKHKGLDWWMTDFREKMIDDLIQSDTLIGLSKEEVINLLGEPEQNEDTLFGYTVRERYERDIDPVYIMWLSIKIKNDTVVGVNVSK